MTTTRRPRYLRAALHLTDLLALLALVVAAALPPTTVSATLVGPGTAPESARLGDEVPSCDGLPATVTADDADEDGTIHGTPGDDVIVGSDGADHVEASTGDDVICTLRGDDRVYVDGGETRVWLGPGDDLLNAIPGQRRVSGTEEPDGPDVVHAGPGSDVLKMVQTDDLLYAGAGADDVRAGCGADVVRGGTGVDVVVDVGPGATASGGAGAGDVVGPGSCWGDSGAVTDLTRQQIRHLPGRGAGAGGVADITSFRDVRGTHHRDIVLGDAQRNRILGGRGDDLLRGGAGGDLLIGRLGSDVLRGGAGRDRVFGGDVREVPPAYDTCTAEVERGCER